MNKTTFSIRQTAKITQFPGGEKKFAKWLREKNFLMAKNEPYQIYIDKGWFLLVDKTIYRTNPQLKVPVTRITVLGLSKLEKLVFAEFHECKPCAE
jgi:phage antirepressor YoqD-like protein